MTIELTSAIRDFREARQKAVLKEVMNRFLGSQNTGLLSFAEVRSKLKPRVNTRKILKEIPIKAIVGSVNRYDDFTRDFLPRESIDEERWARVEIMAYGLTGLPPIEVYQIDQVYFVSDGNHRVSVAKQMRATHIQAYVTEMHSRVSITPDIKPQDLILKAELAEFLEYTNLDRLRPQADINVTVPGQYQELENHIEVHRYYMGIENKHDIPSEEAVAHWYDTVYLPIVQVIRESGLLRDFPGRTETDLYLWLAEHQSKLQEQLSGRVKPEEAAQNLAAHHSPRTEHVVSRLGQKVLSALIPSSLKRGPEPGEWRQNKEFNPEGERLLVDILVPVNGRKDGWHALEQAIIISRREGADLHGLHVVPTEEKKLTNATQSIQKRFNQRCQEVGVRGNLIISVDESVTDTICVNARFNDLVVVNLTYPPASQVFARLSTGFHSLIQRCPRPILAVPQVVKPFQHMLLAYDGSPKAREAMFLATYLSGHWKIPLHIVTVFDDRLPSETLLEAMTYTEDHGVESVPHSERGEVSETILRVATENSCDLILMGGYGYNPVINVVLGSSLDTVLRQSHLPVLICR